MIDTSRKSIEALFAAYADTPIAYPGEPFEPPDGAWIRLNYLWGQGATESMQGGGAGTNRIIGVLQVDIFTPQGEGKGEAGRLADIVRPLVNRVTAGAVRFGTPSGLKRGNDDERWQHDLLDIPFDVEETVGP